MLGFRSLKHPAAPDPAAQDFSAQCMRYWQESDASSCSRSSASQWVRDNPPTERVANMVWQHREYRCQKHQETYP